MKSSKIGYLLHEGFKSIVTHGFMSFATVTIVIACLVIMGSFSLIAVNVSAMLDELEATNEIIAYVEETLPEEEARGLQDDIEYLPNVSSARFVSREEAMEEFASQYDDPTLFQDVASTVLRDRYVIYLDDIALMAQTKAELEDIGVDLRLLERAFSSAHVGLESSFDRLMETYYGNVANAKQVRKKLIDIKNRARYT